MNDFIIFLDIDGVLNLEWKEKWDKTSIENLNKFIEISGGRLVITSTWRANPMIDLEQIFKSQGIIGDIISSTPILSEDRGLEINEWLNKHPSYSDNYLIIDDKVNDILPYHPWAKIIQTSFKSGISDHKLVECLEKYMKML